MRRQTLQQTDNNLNSPRWKEKNMHSSVQEYTEFLFVVSSGLVLTAAPFC
uniref:Uncharacterized protein n=1 Tax=Zea mays TaxID=4577 RepID=C0PA41_MAIZE|nr:unknown [Zea mays]